MTLFVRWSSTTRSSIPPPPSRVTANEQFDITMKNLGDDLKYFSRFFSYSFRLYSILQLVVVDSAWTASRRRWPAMMIVCKCTRVILFITAVTILLIIIPPDWNRTITVSSLAPPQALPRSLLRRWSGWLAGWGSCRYRSSTSESVYLLISHRSRP